MEDVKKIQMDNLDVMSRTNTPMMVQWVEKVKSRLGNENVQKRIEKVLPILKEWDFRFSVDSIAASIGETWEYYFTQSIFAD